LIGNSNAVENSEKDEKLVKALDEVLKKHGPREEVSINFFAQREEVEQELLKLGQQMADPCRFLNDFLTTIREHESKPGFRLVEENAHLENVNIDANSAEADFVQTRSTKERRSSIAFQKIDGQWKISKLPEMLN
jgi:hypothetical protein